MVGKSLATSSPFTAWRKVNNFLFIVLYTFQFCHFPVHAKGFDYKTRSIAISCALTV